MHWSYSNGAYLIIIIMYIHDSSWYKSKAIQCGVKIHTTNYIADCSIFSIQGHCIIDQIRWLSSVDGEIGKHLNFVLVVDFIFNPSLRVMPLSLECPDLKGYLNTDLRQKRKIFMENFVNL